MKKCVLGDVADVKVSGVDKKTNEGEIPVRLCNYTDVYYNWAVTSEKYDGLMRASAKPDEISKFKIKKGQVALTKDSETRDDIGIPTYIADDFDDVLLGYHCALISPDTKELSGKYLNALLRTKYVKDFFGNNAGGSGQRYYLSDSSIKELPLFLPDITVQRKIGTFLSTIDRKIALNRKRIATLEAMAKEIYDYWFVQFDFPDAHGRPYKSSGGAMVYNPDLKREIPKGWEVGVLPDIVEFTNGLPCQRFRPRPGERSLPVLKIKEMHDGITDQTERVKEDIPERFKVYDGDIIFSWSASLEVMVWFYGKAGLNQHIFKVTEKDGWPIHFSFFLLSDYVAIFRRIAESRKTTMGHITSDHLRLSTVPLPQHKVVVEKFEEIVRPIFDALVNAAHEVSNLVNMRDTLLPLLMNGQVKVG